MKLEESFDLPCPRAQVWAAFSDVSMLVSCLPGATLQSAPQNPLEVLFAVKLGPIAARFAGEGTIAYDQAWAGVFSGSGVDRATGSRVRGSAAFRLEEAAEGTRVRLEIEYALSGPLAQFGRPGIVKDIAAGLTRQFASNLRARIAAHGAAAVPAHATAATDPPAPAQTLDAGAMLWRLLWDRLKRLVGVR